ncbi:MAG: hypothetical protein IKO73_07660 [Bacteroidaceae bacterium]|nr:hypothetical protein [Bacteroidaceae bacterium]
MMKKMLLMVVAMTTIMSAKAQKIEVVDQEGVGIPLVTVLTEDGNIIGTTNLNGVLNDIKGAERLLVTHVAYKPQLITVALLKDGRITMEDQDYGLREIVVMPKPYIYVETYYRAYAFINDSLRFYQAGIMPNAYDEQADKVYMGSSDNSCGYFCPSLGATVTWGARVMEFKAGRVGKCIAQNILNNGKTAKKYHITAESTGNNHWRIKNAEGTVGKVEREKGTVNLTMNASRAQMYANKVDGQNRLLKMREKKNYEYQFTERFNCDAEGNSKVEDNVMYCHHWQWDGGKGRMRFIIETYAVDRGYMNKKDFSAKKKELKKKYAAVMPLSKLEEYEQSHGIPALSPTVRQAVLKLKKQ